MTMFGLQPPTALLRRFRPLARFPSHRANLRHGPSSNGFNLFAIFPSISTPCLRILRNCYAVFATKTRDASSTDVMPGIGNEMVERRVWLCPALADEGA